MKLASVVVLCLCLAAPAAAQSPVIATVEGSGEVTRAQFDHWMRIAARSSRLERVPPRGTARHRDLRGQVMQLLIQNLWVAGEAARQGIAITEEQIRREHREQKRMSFPTEREFRRFLRTSGYSEADLLWRIRLELQSNALREKVVASAPAVTDEEVRAEYDADPRDYAIPERRDVRFSVGSTPAAARAGRSRVRLYATRRAFPRAVFRRRAGTVRWRGRWLAFRVLRVHPRRIPPFEEVEREIRASLRSERRQETLDAFIEDFQARWREATTCRARYRAADCGHVEP